MRGVKSAGLYSRYGSIALRNRSATLRQRRSPVCSWPFLAMCRSTYSFFFFFSSRRRHTRLVSDWSSDVCSSDLIQHGHAIFITSVSFHRDEPGLTHQAQMPDVPKPEELPSEAEIKERVLPLMPDPVRRYYERERPIELRPVEYGRYLGKRYPDGHFNVWIRATGKLPDDPAIHQCVLAYASDMTLLDAALIPHGRTVFEKDIMAASLDHAPWLHRPFRADDWLLYAQDSPNLSGSRGFTRGLIFARDGTLVASVAQEGLVRERRPEG